MKKITLGIVSFFLLIMFAFVSCSSNTNGSGNKEDAATKFGEGIEYGTGEYDQASLYIKASNPESLPKVAADRKDTIIMGITAPNGVFNPIFYQAAYDEYIIRAMYEPLLIITPDAKLEGRLADMPEVSDDKKTFTFTLKDGVKWEDGQPITSDDIEFTLKVIMDSSYSGRYERDTLNLVGWKDYRDGKTDQLAGFTKIDDRKFSLELEESNAKTMHLFFSLRPIAKHYYGEKYTQGNATVIEELNRKPFGCGAYKFVVYKDGEEVQLVANENWFKGKAKIPNLVFRAVDETTRFQLLETGQIDVDLGGVTVTPDNVDIIREMGFMEGVITENLGYGYIGMNFNEPELQDVKVRQALVYGLNREDIVYAVFGEYANVLDIPQSTVSWSYPDESTFTQYEYNPEKAKELLDEAGWKVGSDGIREKDGKKLVLKFLASSPNEVNDAIIPTAITNYKDIGIDFQPEQMEFRTLLDKQDEAKIGKYSYHLAFLAWQLTADPDGTAVFGTNGPSNKYLYSNPKLDSLYQDGLKEFDQVKREKIYEDVYKEISEDVPYIFLYQRMNADVYSSRVKGVTEATPFKGMTYQYGDLYFE